MSDKSTTSTTSKCFFLASKQHFLPPPDLLGDHLDGLPVEPEVHVLVLRHDLPAAPAQHRLPDEEGDPLPPDGHTGAPVTHNLNNYYNYYDYY